MLFKIKAFEEAESVKQEKESKPADQPTSEPAERPEVTGDASDWSLLFLVGGGVAFVGLSAAFGYQKMGHQMLQHQRPSQSYQQNQ